MQNGSMTVNDILEGIWRGYDCFLIMSKNLQKDTERGLREVNRDNQ